MATINFTNISEARYGIAAHSPHIMPQRRTDAGLWSQYTKPPTLDCSVFKPLTLDSFIKALCINNGKPNKMVNDIIRHFITTM
jgi:hypothetical protein